MTEPETTLEVTGLTVITGGTRLLRDVSFTVAAGERVGLIGESGSGKSLTAMSIMNLLPDGLRAEGSIRLAGVGPDLIGLPERRAAAIRGQETSIVFQEPMTALNPLMRIGDQVAEVMILHRTVPSRAAAKPATLELLDQVRLPDPERIARSYPHQLSGGMRQRVVLAMALANRPQLVICDEPTSALDVTVQAAMLKLITSLQAERGNALLFITHDLAVVSQLCERVLVLHDGEIVEAGRTIDVFSAPEHPYTQRLLAASAPTFPELVEGQTGLGPSTGSGNEDAVIIEAVGVSRTFRRPRQSLFRAGEPVHALRGVDLTVRAGDRLGIVGESGSGKSTLLRLLAALDRPTTGSITFDGTEIAGRPASALRFLRRDLQIVFQDPQASLDPRMRVRDIIGEPMVSLGIPGIDARVAELLDAVGLPQAAAHRFPHQFSGGQRQRISIARALSPRPRVLVADEPVSALDVSVRAQILALLTDLVRDYQLTLIFVSHDLSVVRQLCDRVAVLHDGAIVEQGDTAEVYENPRHPYTERLLAAVPTLITAGSQEDR
ncbi:dipeptide ABC transporter ATP-binding protein [Microlunatus parietis]|uniref:Peptide/nickel transport system ATP-binding protein n=1 Tax=Microlunatus parietis TaxID=682979 RepID=A0A7Y9I5T6_9ACTN|nr:ABC transporter ATP-binding protein [Microlunatus parietis]NYE70737.1 peptide/nickel transport system ATP-binding protein [Microlunatus parietis]